MTQNKLSVLPTQCDCERCSIMCQGPCCGTPQDVLKLIESGYAHRLMLDDWPDASFIPIAIKPALKGHEGEKAPWDVQSYEGCTFWIDGKCELHNLDLKPIQGRLAHHDNTKEQDEVIGQLIKDAWNTEEAQEVIKKWKKEVEYDDSSD